MDFSLFPLSGGACGKLALNHVRILLKAIPDLKDARHFRVADHSSSHWSRPDFKHHFFMTDNLGHTSRVLTRLEKDRSTWSTYDLEDHKFYIATYDNNLEMLTMKIAGL